MNTLRLNSRLATVATSFTDLVRDTSSTACTDEIWSKGGCFSEIIHSCALWGDAWTTADGDSCAWVASSGIDSETLFLSEHDGIRSAASDSSNFNYGVLSSQRPFTDGRTAWLSDASVLTGSHFQHSVKFDDYNDEIKKDWPWSPPTTEFAQAYAERFRGDCLRCGNRRHVPELEKFPLSTATY